MPQSDYAILGAEIVNDRAMVQSAHTTYPPYQP